MSAGARKADEGAATDGGRWGQIYPPHAGLSTGAQHLSESA